MADTKRTHKPVWYEGPPFKKVGGGVKGVRGPYKKSKCYPVGEYPDFNKDK